MEMSEINNGGPAFPVPGLSGLPNGQFIYPEMGMTLRDYFAAKALPAAYADYCESARKIGFDEGWKMGVALDAYAMADAMLAAREAKQ